VNKTVSRADIEQFTSMALEKRRRRAKVEIGKRGYRDEDGVWQGGLLAFVRYYWPILEPGTVFRDGWALEAVCEHLEAVTFGEITKLLINVPPGFMKSLLTDVFWPAWEWGAMELHHLRYVAFSYSSSLTERDNGKFSVLISSPEYQAMYPHIQVVAAGAKKVSNTEHGWKLATSVGGVGTGERGDRIILDDPHNVKESESEVVRKETIRWFWESMSSRLNDMENGAKIVIMQRVNEEDVSGEIILAGDWVHLLIAMEYVWGFVSDERGEVVPPRTAIGWTDPRWRETPEECDGELAWPERFPERIIPSMKKDAGPFAWACNPYEAPILMADLSMRPIGTVAVGDEIVGFTVGNEGKAGRRARYRKATILDIHKSLQPVVRITFDSGRTIRCTANHKWWTGRGGSRRAYAPAVLGSKLRRVCPPSITPVSPENARAAGWIAGFFDGEGSVSLNQRREHGSASALISFTQSADRNLPLCDKLEANLNLLGFDYGVRHRRRNEGHAPVRSYWLKAGPVGRSSMLSLYQRFIHQIQPAKWRDRIIESAVNSRMFTEKERVISIEPEGAEEVYGLTTTTGNYVVWGLASSNSQYQQTPEARGGGIFKREWWQPWEPGDGKFPPFTYVIVSCDSSYTEKEINDPSAAVVLGIWENAQGYNRVMLMHAWRRRLQFSGAKCLPEPGEKAFHFRERLQKSWGLVEWLADTCTRFKADRLLIESKASGISAAQSLGNSHPHAGWAVQLIEPIGDKHARAISVQPSFSQEMVYVPYPLRTWGEITIDEMAVFPKGKFKDLTDAMTQGIKHLRDLGLLRTDEERRHEELEKVKLKPKQKQLYPGTRQAVR
jgi:predicted phage terminase large subunit-like protein